jgi:hypothetical protein
MLGAIKEFYKLEFSIEDSFGGQIRLGEVR